MLELQLYDNIIDIIKVFSTFVSDTLTTINTTRKLVAYLQVTPMVRIISGQILILKNSRTIH